MIKNPKGKEISPVLIIGGGPTGLSLALGLAKHNIRTVLLEKEKTISQTSKAPVIHVRTREIFGQWGIEEEFLKRGNLVRKVVVHRPDKQSSLFSLDFHDIENEAHQPGILILEQKETEEILLKAVEETGLCDIRFGIEATALEQEEELVKVYTKGNSEILYTRYVAGCDGADSFVRHSLDLPFEGITYSVRTVLADIEIGDDRNDLGWPRFYNGLKGITIGVKLSHHTWRVIHLERRGDKKKEENVPDKEIEGWMQQVMGGGPCKIKWKSPFNIHRRSSPKFRERRVILAGDAAHIHSPVGGQGMNAGIQDAHNLAWKLAQAIRGGNTKLLLDSYETERKAVVVQNVSRYTNIITRTFLQAPLFLRKAFFFMLRRILPNRTIRKKFLRRSSMIDLDYKKSEILENNNPSAGKRLPNPRITSADGNELRLYDLISNTPLILSIGKKREPHLDLDQILFNPGACQESSGILQSFTREKPGWILVRPDLHIAWAGNDINSLKKAVKTSLGR